MYLGAVLKYVPGSRTGHDDAPNCLGEARVMEKGLVPHAADRDAAQFSDSHRHGRGIHLGVARVGLVRKGGGPLVAADPGPRPEAPMRSHRPPILLLRCQHVILCCDGALRRPQPRRVTANEAQRTAASRDLAP